MRVSCRVVSACWLVGSSPCRSDSAHSPDRPFSEPQVVQVCIKPKGESTVDGLFKFFAAQKDITTAIESIVLAHIKSPLPASVIVQGEGYTLHGFRKPWAYGKRVRFTWGSREVSAAEDKWVFLFDPGYVR
ncbi:hypothetical protein LshimejAT787_1103640 [Lyophyllum shimeji]|uniref:Uncharacterized protein n=1 Tax=Lyophyllum shimeji TaxID=47721 RepID=A0A9P3PVJ7_LYOSH|nr:hypothetical protein LshimejAT787_1103640 [Lyophyllum shimeji]